MKKNWKRIGVVAVVLALGGALVLGAVAFAQGPGPQGIHTPGTGWMTPQEGIGPFGRGMGVGPGRGFGIRGAWGGPENSLVAVAAEVLGLERAELVAELQDGKTIADVAEEQGVELDAIVEAFIAPKAEHLAELVTDGRLTQEEADEMLAQMTEHVTARLSEPLPHQGYGPGFADEDGDGVCDYLGSGGQFGRRGAGRMGRWAQ